MKIVERFDPQDILTISSGFLAKYAGSTNSEDIERFQDNFYLWVKEEYAKGRKFGWLEDALKAFLAVQEKVDKVEQVPEIQEEEQTSFVIQKEVTIELGDKNIILEEGDTIRLLKEYRDTAILPFGSVNLVTGDNKTLGNVFDVWGDGSPMICEFWQPTDPSSAKTRLVIGSGDQPNNRVGESKSFSHDQTGRYLFTGKLVDYCLLTDLPSKVSKFGRSLNGYVYK